MDTWHCWVTDKSYWRTGQPPARKETTHSSGKGFLCWHSLCRELLSCVRALLAKLWNIKGNAVVKTWRVWVGQQLLSTRSPSAISLHAMNFSPAGLSFEKQNPILVFWAGLITGCVILCGVEVSWLVPLIQQSWKAWEASLEQSSISGYPTSPFTLNLHKKSATLPSPPLQNIDKMPAGKSPVLSSALDLWHQLNPCHQKAFSGHALCLLFQLGKLRPKRVSDFQLQEFLDCALVLRGYFFLFALYWRENVIFQLTKSWRHWSL